MNESRRVLFVALGEQEVPAYEAISRNLRSTGLVTKVVTWLPRLSSENVESLYTLFMNRPGQSLSASLRDEIDISYIGQLADYDRDWHFAPAKAKYQHSKLVLDGVLSLFNTWRPDVVVSAVGGETLRMAVEQVAKSYGVRAVYFNAIPLKSRFVLLPSLDSPFVAYNGEKRYQPRRSASHIEPAQIDSHSVIQDRSTLKVLEPAQRLYQVAIRDKGIYPKTWYGKKVTNTLVSRILRSIPVQSSLPAKNEVNVLYPMHDERDFQVAVRERHAIPQQHLLKYVASKLPRNFRLWVKPHPEHMIAHHTRRLQFISDVPNISFLPPDMAFSQALDGCDVVFTLASTLGFEALKVGKPVVCYGSPFYSGRQLTLDVDDPREIAGKIESAVGSSPDAELLKRFLNEMRELSWPGQFTPLDLSTGNLALLTKGVLDAIEIDVVD